MEAFASLTRALHRPAPARAVPLMEPAPRQRRQIAPERGAVAEAAPRILAPNHPVPAAPLMALAPSRLRLTAPVLGAVAANAPRTSAPSPPAPAAPLMALAPSRLRLTAPALGAVAALARRTSAPNPRARAVVAAGVTTQPKRPATTMNGTALHALSRRALARAATALIARMFKPPTAAGCSPHLKIAHNFPVYSPRHPARAVSLAAHHAKRYHLAIA